MLNAVVLLTLAAVNAGHPFLEPEYTAENVAGLREKVQDALAMTPEELYGLVPAESGIYFCGCPHCDGGAQENGVLDWELGMGDHVTCRYCGMKFPNAGYPENRTLEITGPSGVKQVYRWYENAEGRQYHFQGRWLYDRMNWFRKRAYVLANLYALTGDPEYGDRAAAIVGRFAEVFPDYAVRYDYPFKPVRFFPADQKYPYDDLPPYRGAKFYWWGYGDIPGDLVRAYDLLAAGDAFSRVKPLLGPDAAARVENDLIRLSYEFVCANPDTKGNMSPGLYRNMILAGRVLNDPAIVHDAVDRFQALLRDRFTFDGWWKEGAPSYHWQTVNNLVTVAGAAKGYTDPPDWQEPRFEDLDLEKDAPMLAKAIAAGSNGLLPDGRLMPINDTWWHSKREPLAESPSRLWPGLGHAVLGAGTGLHQVQVHLNWSGGHGHSHADNGSVILWAHGKELVSDIGYTHTRYRNWTINTASHNTVVVDERSQAIGSDHAPTKGNLLFFDDGDPHVRVIDLDATPAYPQCPLYRRRLVHIHVEPGKDYVVDLFDVAGGDTHDYFWYGSADEAGVLKTSVPLNTSVETLVPAWGGTAEHTGENCIDVSGEQHHAYVFLTDIASAPAAGPWTATWTYDGAGLRSHFFPEDETTLYRFESPAIRGARDRDADLPNYIRRGIMQRHTGGVSRFAAVHEPFGESPWIDAVAFAKGRFTVTHGGQTETIIREADRIMVTSTAGWTYDSGTPRGYRLMAVERGDRFAFRTGCAPGPVRFACVNFGNGHSVGYRVKAVENDTLVLTGDPGFEYDPDTGIARYLYFPHGSYKGVPKVTAYR